jgi:transposase
MVVAHNKKYFTSHESGEIIRYYLSGESTTKIAARFNVNFKVILRILRENKIPIKKQKINLSPSKINKIINLYNSGLSGKEISKIIKINSSKIKKMIRSNVLEVRTASQYTKKFSEQEVNNLISDYKNNFSYQQLSAKYDCSIMLVKKEIRYCLYSTDNIFCRGCKEIKDKINFFDKKQFNTCNQCRNDNSFAKKQLRNKNRSIKRSNSPCELIRHNISSSIRNYLIKSANYSNNKKFSSLPYSKQELKSHLEAQFESWMNWDNYGRYDSKTWRDEDPATWTWQIDHIIPASMFKYSSINDESFKQCWELSNLRPLNSKQNYLDGVRRSRHKKP